MDSERHVTAHYARPGLEAAIVKALAETGKDPEKLELADLSAVDEFHFGWHTVTVEFARALAFPRGAHILDIGSGIGGPARHFAGAHGVRVTGIDLTPDFVEAANGLTERCGLSDLVSFRVASALDMPFDAETFDGAYMIHVGMNIEDKAKLFSETRHALNSGARFGVYDVMRTTPGHIPYPMPWTATPETSFVETPAHYRRQIEAAGFVIESEADRGDQVRTLARQMREKVETDGPSPLGPHTLMGPATPERLGNAVRTLEAHIIAPVEIIARAA
jgi:ubiquinone/menaquinone biosynthesis C-methylase UbiE